MDKAENIRFDLLLKGGKLMDPASGLKACKDVAVAAGKIAAIDDEIPRDSAAKVAEVQELLVTPGLIDLHCHFYPNFPVAQDGLHNIDPDAHLFWNGVTTAVDAGSCGPRDFLYFKERVLDTAKARLFAFVNVADGGMVNIDREQHPKYCVPEIAAAIANGFPKQIVGIKTAHYWVGKPFDDEHPAWAAVDAALQAGEACHKPIMVDFQPTLPERSYDELVLKKLRPGDIHTHMYAQQFPVLQENGEVSGFLRDAKKRGVRFDLGHGAGSFWFRNAVPAFQQGYLPDTLSTDLYFNNVNGPVFGLLHIMSKYLSMGMALMDVLKLTTVAPADIIGCGDIGRLKVGAAADVSVLRLMEGSFGFPDSGGARMRGTKRLECAMTIREGAIVFDPDARTLPDWESAPAPYWVSPGII